MTAGLRERKKQQTRDALSAVATELFAARGFERVTIAEIAATAGVSKMTVTNYFPAKEDLVFDRHEHITTLLSRAVAERPAGVSVLDAVHRAYDDALDRGDPTLGHRGVAFARMVEASAVLRAREREMFEQRELALLDTLAAEMGADAGDIRPVMAAAQLSSVFRILYREARRRLLAGQGYARLTRDLRAAAATAFAQVEAGLPSPFITGR